MPLSANLSLHQTQSLVMTPRLIESIKLLRMNHHELSQFISQKAEENPLLEISSDEVEGDEWGACGDDPLNPPPDDAADSGSHNREEALSSDWYDDVGCAGTTRLNGELDDKYSNVYEDCGSSHLDAPGSDDQRQSGSSGKGPDYYLNRHVAGPTSLGHHLAQQIPFVLPDKVDRLIAQYFVDRLDDAGYLQVELIEVAERLGTSLTAAERVLSALQTLDPPGVFARSLSECLELQLRQKDRCDPAMQTLIENLELLARRDFATLKRLCGVDEEDLLDMLGDIQELNPKPGLGFGRRAGDTLPDVIVRRSLEGGWLVNLNPNTLPRVLVNQSYFSQVTKGGEVHAFLAECLQDADWLTRSLNQRANTIMKVANEIVRQQDAFLLNGVDHLRPLNLKTVAQAIDMSESTVSRVTSDKYMLTPRGLFELKYFFTVSISGVAGGDSHSAEAVRHKIRAVIMQESPDAVLSDDDIVDMLKKGGVDLARRTVAKYRQAMNIASSVQRGREKRARAKLAGS
ncbi:RNA polymerase sigma-54 factor [Rhizobium leguminosarum bv. trifolii WSM597]|uniref:RNA polymerase sigma-54 factor n=1 Tax=Rhizobium leguminosarum bv. trifolii WSM597 TaxID=754764 RepID=J0H9X5_RHILT|nr:RNA polymerase factor sigma-54 [Rhizobium leguminosarum]EJB07168.1 RNA polymerase sigma-54 factor [Rhizobium leguminosarum bv. trifolii WSM597]